VLNQVEIKQLDELLAKAAYIVKKNLIQSNNEQNELFESKSAVSKRRRKT
jgi:hypothetical protein